MKRSARERLNAMVEPALAVVEKALNKVLTTPGMEVSAVAVKLATEVMDRAGYPRASKVELEQVEAVMDETYEKAIVRIVKRAAELVGIDLKQDAARAAVGRAMKEWAEASKKGGR